MAESVGAPLSVAVTVTLYPAVSLTTNVGCWADGLDKGLVGVMDQFHVNSRPGKLFGELALPFSRIVKQESVSVSGVSGKEVVVKLTVGAVLTTTGIESELDPIESCTVKVVA